MAYEEQQASKSKVVVETPTARREVTRTDTVRTPDRNGVSGATVGVIVVVAVAVITILVLLVMNSQTTDTTNANQLAQQQPAQAPPTTIIQQPAAQQQPPIIIQQPAPAGQAPVIVNNPPATGSSNASGNDGAIQAELDKRITEDPNLATLGVTATVYNGKVTLVGVAKSDSQKMQIERMARRIRGVKEVDNQITVSAG